MQFQVNIQRILWKIFTKKQREVKNRESNGKIEKIKDKDKTKPRNVEIPRFIIGTP